MLLSTTSWRVILEFYLALLRRGLSRTSIVPALRHALACKGYSVRALGQTLSNIFSGKSKSLRSSSSVAESMIVAAFLLGNPLSHPPRHLLSSSQGGRFTVQRLRLPRQTTSDRKKLKLLQKSKVRGPWWVSTCNRDLTGQSGSYSS